MAQSLHSISSDRTSPPAGDLSDVFLSPSLALARCAQALRAAPLSRPDPSAAAGLPVAACRLAPLMAAESVLSLACWSTCELHRVVGTAPLLLAMRLELQLRASAAFTQLVRDSTA